jgi:hypothetical protein
MTGERQLRNIFLSSAYIMLVMGFEKELQKDERIILDEAKIAFRDKIILTNRRLIILQPKGFLSSTFVKSYEIPLSNILEAYTDMDGFTGNSSVILKLRNGEKKELKFDPGAAATLLGPVTRMQLVLNAITDRWVNTINRAIDKKE